MDGSCHIQLVATEQAGSLRAGEEGVQERDKSLLVVWSEASSQLAKVVSALCRRGAEVDDILQDVYLAAMKDAPQGLGGDELRRWLFRVAINRCHLEFRRRQRWKRVLERLFLLGPWTGASNSNIGEQRQVLEADEHRVIGKALEQLPHEVRAVLVLRYFAELESTEIAQILGVASSTVRNRLREARSKLADEFAELGYEHP